MAKIRMTGGHSWVEVLPGDEGYDDATDVGNAMMVIDGADAAGRKYGGRSEAGVEDVSEDYGERIEAQVSTGVGQFGLKPEGDQRGHWDFADYTGSVESLGAPTGTLSTGEISTPGATPGATPDADGGDDSAVTDAFKQWTLSQQQATAAAAAADLQSAREILAGMMEEFGLPSSLTDLLNAELVRGESPTALAMRIRTTEEYKARFPGMVLRRDLKLPAITEAEYLDLESQYRSIMRAANLPPTFHDAPEDFTTLIAGDVSGQELQQRVALAESARETANQDIITELQDNYGLTEGDLTAYYLDPGAAKNIFEERRMYEAAGLSVAATQAIGEGLEVKTAEALQRENIQRREIQSRLGQRAGLTEDLLGSEGMSATQVAEAEFGLDVDEATRLRRLREARLAPTMGAGTALTTAQGITGLGAAQ